LAGVSGLGAAVVVGAIGATGAATGAVAIGAVFGAAALMTGEAIATTVAL